MNHVITRWRSADGKSLVGYVRSGKVIVVAGAPICAEPDLARVTEEFSRFVEDQGCELCYFGAESRLYNLLKDSEEYTFAEMGAQPEWSPAEFAHRMMEDASLRAQINRSKNKGVVVEQWPAEKAENHPELARVLGSWLDDRGLPPLHFLVEPDTLSDLRDRKMFVAMQSGEIQGFVTLCPVPQRKGWLTEQFVRLDSAPNGVIEQMMFTAATWCAERGDEYWTLGMAPLRSGRTYRAKNPLWLRILSWWARAHANRFYNFRGLASFKAKFHPEVWTPIMVIVKGNKFKLSHLRGIVSAFTQILPEAALMIGLGRAIRSEAQTFSRAIKRMMSH